MNYELIRSNRKTIALQIKGDGRIIVRAPLRMAERDIQRFITSKAAWIEKHLVSIQPRRNPVEAVFTLEQLQQLAEAAKQDIPQPSFAFFVIRRKAAQKVAALPPLVKERTKRIKIIIDVEL